MLLLSLLLMHFMLGVFCLAVSRGKQPHALRLWGWGLIAYASGALLTIAGAPLGIAFKQTAGNTIIALAALLTASAMIAHTRVQLNRLPAVIGLLIVTGVLAANHLRSGGPVYIIDVAMPTLYGVAVYLVAIFCLLRAPPRHATNAARFVALMAGVAVLIWLFRLAAIAFSMRGQSDPAAADLAFSLFAIGQNLSLVATTLGLMWIEVRRTEQDLTRAAMTDGLTGLKNRRAMSERFVESLSFARREKQPLALVLIDIDRFKAVNDVYGHLAGDAVLRDVAGLLGAVKRREDVLGRIGGEEFLLLLPKQSVEEAGDAAERMRRMVESSVIETGKGEVQTTISAGVASYPDDGEDWDRLFGAADRRLYIAKQNGRNRVIASDAVNANGNGSQGTSGTRTAKNEKSGL